MRRRLLLCPGATGTDRLPEILDLAREARIDGFEPVIAVDVRTAHTVDFEGLRTHRVLDDSLTYQRTWSARRARLLALEQHSVLGDRLLFLHQSMRLGFDDQVVLPFASVMDLDLLWPYLMATCAVDRPSLVVVLQQLFPDGIAADHHRTTFRTDDLLRTISRRLDALGLLASDRFLVGAGHQQIAGLLTHAGIAATHTGVPARPDSPRQTIAVTGDLHAPWIDEFVTRRSDTDPALVLVPNAMVDEALAEAGDSLEMAGWFDIRSLDFLPSLARRASKIRVTPDLLEHVLSCSATASMEIEVVGEQPTEADRSVASGTRHALQRAASACAAVPAERDFVVHIAPNWGGLGCSHVFEAQLRFLEMLGVAVLVIHVDVNDLHKYRPEGFHDLLSGLPARGAVHRWSMLRESDEANEYDQDLAPSHERPFLSYEGEARVARQTMIPASLRRAVRARNVTWVLCNYGHLMPIVERLELEDVPIICETHDVRAEQHRLQNSLPELDSSNARLEIESWAQSAGVVFINDAERLSFLREFPDTPAITAIPYFRPVEQGSEMSALPTPASSILAAAGGQQPPVSLLLELAARGRTVAYGRRFVLFVGSDHDANVESLTWYISEVHLRRLNQHGVELIVAGNIAKSFTGVRFPGVHFLGRVDDLEPLYEAVDVTALAVIAGTGMPIKTIDSVVRNLPFVATSAAVKAVPALVEAVPTFDDPAEFADRVLALIDNPEADDRTVDAGQWSTYVEQWVQLLRDAGISVESFDQSEPDDAQHQPAHPEPSRQLLRSAKVPLSAVRALAGIEAYAERLEATGAYARIAVPAPNGLPVLQLEVAAAEAPLAIDVFVSGRRVGRTAAPTGLTAPLRIDTSFTGAITNGWTVVEFLLSYPCTETPVAEGGLLVESVGWTS